MLDQIKERLREDPQTDGDRCAHRDRGSAPHAGYDDMRRIGGRLGEEHQHDDPYVEVSGDPAGDDTDNDQRDRAALGRRR